MLTPREQNELARAVAEQVIKMLDARGGQPKLVDANGLAKAIGVSQSTIDRWTAQGLIPVTLRIGNVRRFSIDDVIEALSKAKDVSRSDFAPASNVC